MKRAGASTAHGPLLAALSEGLTQQVLIGAMNADEAVEILRSEIKAVRSGSAIINRPSAVRE